MFDELFLKAIFDVSGVCHKTICNEIYLQISIIKGIFLLYPLKTT
jgi:hypothetical protein